MFEPAPSPVGRSAGSHAASGARDAERVLSIDALRGVAALGVAGFHLYFQNGGEALKAMFPPIIDTLLYAGSYGVQLFFVISGFVVALTLYPNRQLTGFLGVTAYFLRRSIRLDPTYWLVLALYALFVPIVSTYSPADAFDARNYDAPEFFHNVFYFLPIETEHDFYMPVAWTLGLEVQFYLFFAGIIVLTNWLDRGWRVDRDTAIMALCALMVGVSAMHNFGVIATSPGWLPTQMKTFVGGILIALSIMKVRGAIPLLMLHLALMGVAIVWLHPQYLLGASIAVLIVLGFTHVRALDRLAAVSFLVPLGTISYGFYLVHQLVGAAVIDGLQVLISDEPGWLQLLFMGIGVAAAIAASALIYQLVERPSIALSKRIRLGAPRVARLA